MSILALCPSRNRPAAAHETLASFLQTRKDPGSRLVFVVDSDDATVKDYPAEYVHVIPPTGCMGRALNTAGHDPAVLADATSVGMIGDDNRFRTPGWDLILDGWLTANRGIAYGDDGFQHERLPTSWWMSRPIVDAFGMTDSGLRHFYMDNWAKALGEGARCLRYFPEVSIEHMHPLAGKASDDAIYRRGQANVARDRAYFHRWQRVGLPRDLRRLRSILNEGKPRTVLADWHHPALWESLSILFEDRFGWQLYSPFGVEWKEHGWAFDGAGTGWHADDYLTFPDAKLVGDHYQRSEPEYPARPRKLVTWQQAQERRWDFVLASVPEHQQPFGELARTFGARLIHQVGNARHDINRHVPQIILASSQAARGRNVLRYHQEFDTKLFSYTAPTSSDKVTSFMLRLDSTSCPYDWFAKAHGVRWQELGGADPRAKSYLSPMSKVADALRRTGWVWHDKRIGDGYGHALFNAVAMGRPLIGHASHYAGQTGEPLWKDLDTCIDLDKHSETDALRLWRAISADPEWHRDLAERTAATFTSIVDFDAEAEAIREALN